MSRVLMLCSTVDGQTRRICGRIGEVLQLAGHQVEQLDLDALIAVDPAAYDSVVVGASIRYGHHRPAVLAFANKHAAALNAMHSAFFSVNIVARKPDKDRADTNPYVRKFLRQVAWRPKQVDVFAGKLDYPRYRPADRWMIRLIMWLTHGPTDPRAVVEFTDWQRVDAFARTLAALR
ncbi:MAG: menaquinone-dependent protoporphyrinogen IX dehydrogenase [Burkholderiales bacterium]|nr:menaquinone-dependent protoporphyrinogen IX dehydrogenase [Burkholderiales bacterium]